MTTAYSASGAEDGMEGTPLVCASVRDDLALWVRGELPVSSTERAHEHLSGCAECQAEAEFLKGLLEARPEVAVGLADAVLARLGPAGAGQGSSSGAQRSFRKARSRPLFWRLPAAALIVVALGVAWLWNGAEQEAALYSLAFEAPAERWGDEEWFVAGAPHLDGLSDEMLRVLMEEYD